MLNSENALYSGPRKDGNKDDKAHPPIYPVKLARESDFKTIDEAKVYKLLSSHFLAQVSKDAVAEETSV